MRFIRSPPFIICGESLGYNLEGDHVVPISKGGGDSTSNFIPLCKRHNASKGNKDLKDWGMQKHFIGKFTPNFLCTYARGTFRFQKENGEHDSIAPDFLKNVVKDLADLYLLGGTDQNYWANLKGSPMFIERLQFIDFL